MVAFNLFYIHNCNKNQLFSNRHFKFQYLRIRRQVLHCGFHYVDSMSHLIMFLNNPVVTQLYLVQVQIFKSLKANVSVRILFYYSPKTSMHIVSGTFKYCNICFLRSIAHFIVFIRCCT